MDKKFTYHAAAHWTAHKRGIVEAEGDIPRTINFAAPPEFGGEPGLWTPEHLWLAAISTCFVATFRAVAEASKLEVHGLEVPVEGLIEKQDGKYQFTKVILRPAVTICDQHDRERTGKVLEKAERSCLIARSTSAAIVLESTILVESPVAV
jgi:peroxiredoxin-like protein